MMLYILFALTTAIAAMYELFIPVMSSLEVLEPEDLMIRSRKTSYIVLFIMSVLTAPLLFLPCIIPSIGQTFRDKMLTAVTG